MKYLTLIAAVVLVGSTVAACTDDSYNGRTQYGSNTDRNRDGIPDNRQSVRNNPNADKDGDGVRNSRDRTPNNPYYR